MTETQLRLDYLPERIPWPLGQWYQEGPGPRALSSSTLVVFMRCLRWFTAAARLPPATEKGVGVVPNCSNRLSLSSLETLEEKSSVLLTALYKIRKRVCLARLEPVLQLTGPGRWGSMWWAKPAGCWLAVPEQVREEVLKENGSCYQKEKIKSVPVSSSKIKWQTLFSWAPKSLQMVTAAMKLKDVCSLERKLWQTWTAY